MPAVQKNPGRSVQDFHTNRVVGGGKGEGHIDRVMIPGKGWVSEQQLLEELVGLDPKDIQKALEEVVSREHAEREGLILLGDDGLTYYEEHLALGILDNLKKKYPEKLKEESEVKKERPVLLKEKELKFRPISFR